MIESYDPNRTQTLVRNPYFRPWSPIATPDGYPDEIVFRFNVGARAGVAAVGRGRADVAYLTTAATRPDELEARFPSRLHLHPEQATVFVFLNTTLPPFDEVRVRRALALAIDRAAIARALGAPQLAQVTCQLRPPGTVGFRRYCPYTAAPDPTGEWKAPDLPLARRLVAAAGTRGMKVEVWSYPGFWVPGAQGAVSALRRLGYRARLRLARTSAQFFAKTGDRSARALQAGMMGLYDIPRTPDSTLTKLACSSSRPGTPTQNFGFLCDRSVDARIARALELQATDPDAAVGAWTQIEKQLVDLASWIPLVTPWSGDLVSKRVGNYQYNPTDRILFDQLWVR
jgi:peptide/nickel transport system substrate-binding protein